MSIWATMAESTNYWRLVKPVKDVYTPKNCCHLALDGMARFVTMLASFSQGLTPLLKVTLLVAKAIKKGKL